jgi:hypothetical protein
MNVSTIITKEYEIKTLGEHGKNEPKTNPIKANLLNAQMNVNKVLTKDYEIMSNWAICENEPNSNPIQTQTNPMLARHQYGGTNPICLSFRWSIAKLIFRHKRLTVPYKSVR